MVVRVLVCDDSSLVRRGTTAVLQATPGINLVGTADCGRCLIAEVSRLQPDVVLIDPALRSGDGLEAIRALRRQYPKLNFLVLTRDPDPVRALQTIEAGAVGYVLKDIAPADLIRGIGRIAAGSTILNPAIARQVVEQLAQHDGIGPVECKAKGLTVREVEILTVLPEGMGVREMAARFHLSEATIKTHLKHIYRKLGARNRAHAAALAIRYGLRSPLAEDRAA